MSDNQDIVNSLTLKQTDAGIKLHYDGYLFPDVTDTLDGSFRIEASYKDLYYDKSGKTIAKGISDEILLTVDYKHILDISVPNDGEINAGVFDGGGSTQEAISVTSYLDSQEVVTKNVNLYLYGRNKETQEAIDNGDIRIDNHNKICWNSIGGLYVFNVIAQPKELSPEYQDYYAYSDDVKLNVDTPTVTLTGHKEDAEEGIGKRFYEGRKILLSHNASFPLMFTNGLIVGCDYYFDITISYPGRDDIVDDKLEMWCVLDGPDEAFSGIAVREFSKTTNGQLWIHCLSILQSPTFTQEKDIFFKYTDEDGKVYEWSETITFYFEIVD